MIRVDIEKFDNVVDEYINNIKTLPIYYTDEYELDWDGLFIRQMRRIDPTNFVSGIPSDTKATYDGVNFDFRDGRIILEGVKIKLNIETPTTIDFNLEDDCDWRCELVYETDVMLKIDFTDEQRRRIDYETLKRKEIIMDATRAFTDMPFIGPKGNPIFQSDNVIISGYCYIRPLLGSEYRIEVFKPDGNLLISSSDDDGRSNDDPEANYWFSIWIELYLRYLHSGKLLSKIKR